MASICRTMMCASKKTIIMPTLPGKCTNCAFFRTLDNGNKCVLFVTVNLFTKEVDFVDTSISYNNYCRGEYYDKNDTSFMELLRTI